MRPRFGFRRTSSQPCCLPSRSWRRPSWTEGGDVSPGQTPVVSSHLQPLYAWKQKLQRRCKPGQLVRLLATLILRILERGPCAPLRKLRAGPCHGSSDAGESDTRATIGGWFSTSPTNPDKFSVYWFALDVTHASWMEAILEHTTQKRRIGALDMMGSLLLFILAADSVHPGTIDVQIRLRTDNEGNAYSASKRSSKKWPRSVLLVELAAREHLTGIFPSLTHVKGCSNTWADQLTHLDFAGFNRFGLLESAVGPFGPTPGVEDTGGLTHGCLWRRLGARDFC